MLRACLQALELNSARFDEAVVSDDGSNPESVRAMKAFFPEFSFPIRFVRQKHEGFRVAAARNNGIRLAVGEYLVVVDCDILLLPDAMDVHLRKAQRGCFLAGNRAFLDEASSLAAMDKPLTRARMEDFWRLADKSHITTVFRQFERNRLVRKLKLARRHKPKILGCHFSLFKEDVEKINGFDEQYAGWGFEDDDFSMRLHKAGIRGQSIIKESRALHLQHEPVPSKPQKLSECLNTCYFKRRHVPAFCVNGLNKLRMSE